MNAKTVKMQFFISDFLPFSMIWFISLSIQTVLDLTPNTFVNIWNLFFYFISFWFSVFFSCFWYFFFKEGEQTSFKSLRSVRWKMFKTFQFYRKDIFLQGKLGGKGIKRGGPMNERGAKKWKGGQGMEGIWKNHNPLSRM